MKLIIKVSKLKFSGNLIISELNLIKLCCLIDEKNSQLNFLDQSENYSYETEHVIDEESVFKRTNDSFSN